MKRARIVLSALAVFAVVGGAVAFKASKFTGFGAYTVTNQYTTFGTIYTRAAAAYLPINPVRFITSTGALQTTVYSTTTTTAVAPITLTRIGGTETITFPAWTGVQLPNTFTTVVN